LKGYWQKSHKAVTDFFDNNKVDALGSKKLINKLKKKKPKDLDAVVHRLHDAAFQRIECLNCANCCKTTGPLFTDKDIQRISKHLKISAKQFENQYLRLDEDGDWVLQQLPCPFLGADNYCGIYEHRPKACATFPHTDRVKQHQILHLTEKNATVCPAVFTIVEQLKQHYR
jgi:Fe-S-cluster containining protein